MENPFQIRQVLNLQPTLLDRRTYHKAIYLSQMHIMPVIKGLFKAIENYKKGTMWNVEKNIKK